MSHTNVIIDLLKGTMIMSVVVLACGGISQAFTNLSPDLGSQFDSMMLHAINLFSAIPTELFAFLLIVLGLLGAVVVKAR